MMKQFNFINQHFTLPWTEPTSNEVKMNINILVLALVYKDAAIENLLAAFK
jgi:hypothetical protein